MHIRGSPDMNLTLEALAGTLLFVALYTLFAFTAWYSAREWGRQALLKLYGKRVSGTIVSIRSSHYHPIQYFATYKFYRENKKYKTVVCRKEQQISRKHIELIKIGEWVAVNYLPDNPQIAELIGHHVDRTARKPQPLRR